MKWWSIFGLLMAGFMLSQAVVPLFATRPYTGVEILRADVVDGRMHLVANFHKNGDCELLRFQPTGIILGVTRRLEFTDGDGLPEDFDREEGSQTLNISIDVGDVGRVEIRTRHLCKSGDDEKTVDRIFAAFDLTD